MCLGIYVVLIMLLARSEITNGIDCYDCTSSGTDNCLEVPNGSELIISGYVASGCLSCVKEFKALGTVFYSITRRCGDASETTDKCDNVLGYGTCVCTTSFCNSGETVTSSTVLLPLTTMFVFCLFTN